MILELDIILWIGLSKRKERKNFRYFEMSFSCFKPFGVWGVTPSGAIRSGKSFQSKWWMREASNKFSILAARAKPGKSAAQTQME